MLALNSDQMTRLAAFVRRLEALSAELGVEVAAHSGTGLVIDGEEVYSIELCNRAEQPGPLETRVPLYRIESSG